MSAYCPECWLFGVSRLAPAPTHRPALSGCARCALLNVQTAGSTGALVKRYGALSRVFVSSSTDPAQTIITGSTVVGTAISMRQSWVRSSAIAYQCGYVRGMHTSTEDCRFAESLEMSGPPGFEGYVGCVGPGGLCER